MNEQTHTAKENVSNETPNEEINSNSNAEQTVTEENRTTSREEDAGKVDFAQMYDMLTERDKTIKDLKEEIKDLKKSNTDLLLKVNSSKTSDGNFKNPYESFIDDMVKR